MPVVAATNANAGAEESLGIAPGNQDSTLPNLVGLVELNAETEQQLPKHLCVAVGLVKSELKPERIYLESASDPDGTSEWVAIRADVRASIDEVLQRYANCKSAWLRVASPSEQSQVRFLYNIL